MSSKAKQFLVDRAALWQAAREKARSALSISVELELHVREVTSELLDVVQSLSEYERLFGEQQGNGCSEGKVPPIGGDPS